MNAPVPTGFSIRTITAGLTLDSADDLLPVEEAARFLGTAQTAFENAGIPVQSTRIATQPLGDLVRDKGPDQAIRSLQKLDRFVADRDLLISVGPLLEGDVEDRDFPSWAAELVAATDETYFSIAVSDQESRVFPRSVQTAARTIRAISRIGANGEANFRFGAAARVPASTPFFPVAYHAGTPAFSIGLESAGLVSKAFANATDIGDAAESLRTLLEERLLPVQTLAMALSAETSRHYVGIDLSPAPSVEISIAEPIESLTQQPFGAPTTLAACASDHAGAQDDPPDLLRVLGSDATPAGGSCSGSTSSRESLRRAGPASLLQYLRYRARCDPSAWRLRREQTGWADPRHGGPRHSAGQAAGGATATHTGQERWRPGRVRQSASDDLGRPAGGLERRIYTRGGAHLGDHS